jgi:probable rRNA maturation factor
MNSVDIGVQDVKPPPWQDNAAAFAGKVLSALGRDNWDLSLLFCGNACIKTLNGRYRNADEPTDVLSFPLGEYDGDRYLPGDIVISLDALAENARFFGVSPGKELQRLIIHGILHLDGMDHAGNGPEESMLKKQEELLETLADNSIISEE